MSGRIRSILVSSLMAVSLLAASVNASRAQDGLTNSFFPANEASNAWKVMLFGGILSENELADIIIPKSKGSRLTDTNFIGLALSNEVYRWRGFSIDLEGGAGYQFGEFRNVDNSAGQVWGAAYFRYDGFPWNHIIHTSVAGSVGINIISEKTVFENQETKNGDTVHLLHYFSPEIAFSLPEARETELVVRLHHRSSASGAFGCVGCGSNFITVGIRHQF